MKVKNEILKVFFDESEEPIAIMRKNGTTEFFKLKPMTNDDLDQLLGVEESVK